MGLFGIGSDNCHGSHNWGGWHQKGGFSHDWFRKCQNRGCDAQQRRKEPPPFTA